jgi:hypothetical protein
MRQRGTDTKPKAEKRRGRLVTTEQYLGQFKLIQMQNEHHHHTYTLFAERARAAFAYSLLQPAKPGS